jgi:hypothetical protein
MEFYHCLIFADKVDDPPDAVPQILPVLLVAPNESAAVKELNNIALEKFPTSLGYCDIDIRIHVVDKNALLDLVEQAKREIFKEDDTVLESVVLD